MTSFQQAQLHSERKPTIAQEYGSRFLTTKVIAYFDDDSSTVPWCFFSSFQYLNFSFFVLLKGENPQEQVSMNLHLHHTK